MKISYSEIDKFWWNKDGKASQIFNVCLVNQDKALLSGYGAAGDLFMMVKCNDCQISKRGKCERTFFVPRNDDIYPLFLKLYKNVVDANISSSGYGENERLKMKLKRTMSYRDILNYRGEIVWQSDDDPWNLSRVMTIKSGQDGIELSFESRNDFNPEIPSRDRDHCVFISNSGSRYEPFNICFAQLHQELQPANFMVDGEIANEE